ncbi:MAG: hypothetical protein QNJ54_35715 [Prochloraceae cyanobacterium]|nr:hypothetical protein [Prochloraceae cyanobacterium]
MALVNYTYSRKELIRDLINFRLMALIDDREENCCTEVKLRVFG